MGMTTIDEQCLSVPVKGDVAIRTLERAARSRARIRIQLRDAMTNRRINGYVISAGLKTIMVDAGDSEIDRAAQGAFCDVTLSVDEGLYVFASRVAKVQSNDGGGVHLELTRPASLQLMQRRRFVRARLSTSTTVRIEPVEDAAFDAFDASLLNLAEEGLAARTELALADRLSVDQMVRIRFRSDASPDEFDLRAILRRKTAAGDRGQVIMGLTFEFDDDESGKREAVRDAVRHYIL